MPTRSSTFPPRVAARRTTASGRPRTAFTLRLSASRDAPATARPPTTTPSAACGSSRCASAAGTSGAHGAWLKPGETTEYAFDGEKSFSGVRLVVDTNMNDNRWLVWWIGPKKTRQLPDEMPRDFDVQVRSGGEWKTVKSVRDNYRRWLDLRFDMPIAGDACRVVWTRPWGETTEQRVFSFEVY